MFANLGAQAVSVAQPLICKLSNVRIRTKNATDLDIIILHSSLHDS